MKKLTVQQKTTITGGYAWDKIALGSIATSVTGEHKKCVGSQKWLLF